MATKRCYAADYTIKNITLNLFDDVRDKYELVEHGKLIDVYKRKKE